MYIIIGGYMETIKLVLDSGEEREYIKGIKLSEVLETLSAKDSLDVIVAKYNGKVIRGNFTFERKGKLSLYNINTNIGNKAYERGLIYLFELSASEVLGSDTKIIVKHSIDKGVFCKINKEVSEENISDIKKIMKQKVKENLPIIKIETTKQEALDYFKSIKREDKFKTLFYKTDNLVTLYKIEDSYNYFMGEMPLSTSALKYFDLTLIKEKGVVVRFPSIYDNAKVIKYTHHDNYFNSLEEYTSWGEKLGINNLGELNDLLSSNGAKEIVQLSEIMQDYKLLSIAEEIVLNKDNYKIVLLSGPSSSGKTTTAMKLSLYLKSLGLNPTHLSIDDYFHEREETPLRPDGKPDFESLRAVDTKLFDNQINKLLKGTKVTVPTFNFITGKKEYKRKLELKQNDILLVEGLHALNENILTDIPKKNKYKIYVSPLTYLNIDNDNRISMTDLRLLRRIVRDNRTRGYEPIKTLNSWHSVREGEEKYVFPYQDNANVIFNSSLAYELGTLKIYAEPLLYTVKENDPEYQTAQRLLELLKCTMPVPSEYIPKTSILREFIGESYFE